jgi:Arc/MetJ-type ribon-helix-helix transcriptional regulator
LKEEGKEERKEKEGERRYTTISLPKPLAEKIKKRIEGTGFTSLSSYVAYILREVISSANQEEPLSKEDEERIKARLKALGYL